MLEIEWELLHTVHTENDEMLGPKIQQQLDLSIMVLLGPNIRIGQSKATTPTNFHECLNFGSKKQFIFYLS